MRKTTCMLGILLVILLMITACKPSVTGKTALETEDVKENKVPSKKYTVSEEVVQKTIEENQRKACERQMDELKEMINDDLYALRELKGDQKKIALAMQHFKDQYGGEEEYDEQLQLFEENEEKLTALATEQSERENALELLEEKCGDEKSNTNPW